MPPYELAKDFFSGGFQSREALAQLISEDRQRVREACAKAAENASLDPDYILHVFEAIRSMPIEGEGS